MGKSGRVEIDVRSHAILQDLASDRPHCRSWLRVNRLLQPRGVSFDCTYAVVDVLNAS